MKSLIDEGDKIALEMCRITDKRADSIEDLGIDFDTIDIEGMEPGDERDMPGGPRVQLGDDYIPIITDLAEFDIGNEINEVSGAICKDGDQLQLKNVGVSCSAAGCSIDFTDCDVVGSFHTHPLNVATPSIADVGFMLEKKHDVMCVGSKVNGKTLVLCLQPKDAAKTKAQIGNAGIIGYSNVNPLYGHDDIEPDAKVLFYREDPLESPSSLIEWMRIEDVDRYYNENATDESLAEFRSRFITELKKGIHPDEYLENVETQGYEDTLDIYIGEKQEELLRKRLRPLREHFHVKKLDCEKILGKDEL